jgi:UDP-N-acetylmuramate: L-alanyl-gamma-D-glutamyl-meso-diaminopimelate ligase
VVGYGVGDGEHGFRAVDLDAGPAGTAFRVLRDEHEVARAVVPLYGRHNVANALGALVTAASLGVPVQEAATALAGFRGVRRRQEVRGEARRHGDRRLRAPPDGGARDGRRDAHALSRPRLVAVLEPRSNTSRRALFQHEFADALAGADRVVISIVPPEPLYSATGEVTEYLDAARIAADLRARGVEAAAIDGVPAIVDQLAANAEPGDVVLVMSNGEFGGLWTKLLDRLALR